MHQLVISPLPLNLEVIYRITENELHNTIYIEFSIYCMVADLKAFLLRLLSMNGETYGNSPVCS